MKGIFISGSGTNVGKTLIASYVIRALNAKYSVVARKPIESGCLKTHNRLVPRDAEFLNSACINPDPMDRVCKFRFEACVNGEKASLEQNNVVDLQDLITAVQPMCSDDFVVIEGAGGFCSPIAKQTLNSDFASALGLPIMIVVKDELGAINQALLTINAAKQHNLEIVLILNQIIPNNLDNAAAIRAYTDATVLIFNKDKLDNFNAKIQKLI